MFKLLCFILIIMGYNESSMIKGVSNMRRKTLNFEQLVNQNRQELLEDEKKITQIEMRLEKKKTDLTNSKQK